MSDPAVPSPGSDPFGFSGPAEIIAHRGYSARAPENTLAALEAALAAGADAIEFDLQLTSDGVPVLLHDEELDRTTDGEGPVGACPWSTVRGLDAGSWFGAAFAGEPVPSLESALRAARGRVRRLYPEVKRFGNPDGLRRIVEALVSAGLLERTVAISMDWDALDVMRAHAPELRIGYIVEAPERAAAATARAGGDPLALVDFDARILLADPSLAATASARDVPLAAWTVDDPLDAARLLAMGVPRITTNRVEALLGWKNELALPSA